MARLQVEQEFSGEWVGESWGVSPQAASQFRRGDRSLPWTRVVDAIPPDWAGEAIVARAIAFAINAHQGQKRKNNTPYYAHPLRVSGILAGWGCDWRIVAAGALHDVVEDSDVEIEEIQTLFGVQVAEYVRSVSENLLLNGEQDKTEYFERQAALAFQGYPGVWVAIADKLDNGRCFIADEAAGIGAISLKWRDRYRFMDECIVTPFVQGGRLDGHAGLMMADWQKIMRWMDRPA